jgi:biopolymer transport protein ExbD
MRAPSAARSAEVGINMTPMIDMVFLLIIFFLLSSTLVQQETQVDVALPKAKNVLDDPADNAAGRVTINVQENGAISFLGRNIVVDELAARIADRVKRQGGIAEIRIRASRKVPYAKVEPILLACSQAGVWDVQFAVFRDDEE